MDTVSTKNAVFLPFQYNFLLVLEGLIKNYDEFTWKSKAKVFLKGLSFENKGGYKIGSNYILCIGLMAAGLEVLCHFKRVPDLAILVFT